MNLEAMKKVAETDEINHGIILKTIGGDNTGKGNPEGMRKFKGTEGVQVSKFVIQGRKCFLNG